MKSNPNGAVLIATTFKQWEATHLTVHFEDCGDALLAVAKIEGGYMPLMAYCTTNIPHIPWETLKTIYTAQRQKTQPVPTSTL